jgi:hypothetical protein
VRGHVAATIEGDEALAIIDRLVHKYTGEPFLLRTGRVYLVEAARGGLHRAPVQSSACALGGSPLVDAVDDRARAVGQCLFEPAECVLHPRHPLVERGELRYAVVEPFEPR